MALFLRLFVIAFAFLLACFAAGFVVAYGLLSPELAKIDPNAPDLWAGLWFIAAIAGIVTPFFVFAPAALVILFAEIFAWRSVIFYALAGGFCGVLAYFLSDPQAHMRGTGTVAPLTWELQLLAAGGIVGGFVYWLIAGRRAGMWKEFPPRA